MTWLFWISAIMLGYTYAGYAAWLWLRLLWRRQPVVRSEIFPYVSIIIAVHNEAAVLPGKLATLRELDYPPDRHEILVVSDGSTDDTNKVIQGAGDQVRGLICPDRRGKAAAINDAVAAAKGEILLFTDARQSFAPDAVRSLVADFADPNVGCVSGELMLHDKNSDPLSKGLGLYWRWEKRIRQLEAATGSMVGATGAIYAARRNLVLPLPSGTILDDVLIPLRVAQQGKRVIFEPKARAWDAWSEQGGHEFRRKVRTLIGNYQLLRLAPWLVTPRNPLLLEFVSHKLLRLISPLFLLSLLCASVLLHGLVYRTALLLQALVYGLALVALAKPRLVVLRRPADAAFTFLALNTAAAVAFFYFVTKKRGVWTR